MNMMHKYDKLILEQYLDGYGHVNNASYLTLLEEARWDLIDKKGFGFEKIMQDQIGPIVLEVNLRFTKELRLREWIEIQTQLLSYQGKIGQIEQKIIKKEDASIAAHAVLKIGLFDLKNRKLISPTPEWIMAFQ